MRFAGRKIQATSGDICEINHLSTQWTKIKDDCKVLDTYIHIPLESIEVNGADNPRKKAEDSKYKLKPGINQNNKESA